MRVTQAYTEDDWLTIGQAADLFQCHPETLRRYERKGLIAAARTPTGHRRFRRADIEALLQPPTPTRSAS